MTRNEFIERITHLVGLYIDNRGEFDSSPQLRINPASLDVTIVNGGDILSDIADADEAVEMAAGEDRPADEDAGDMQARQNPDFYAVSSLMTVIDGKTVPARRAIASVAANYVA